MCFLCLFLFFVSFQSFSQSADECFCDTIFKSIKEGTNRTDSVNWKSVECYHSSSGAFQKLRGLPNLKSLVYYRDGKRHGVYTEYHPINYAVVVPQFGYQQKNPRRYKPWKDIVRKSVYRAAISGKYENGLKEGAWISYDTNQRIIQERFFHQGQETTKETLCNGINRNPYLDRADLDSIKRHVKTAKNGSYTLHVGKDECSYTVKDGKLNGSLKNYVHRKKQKLIIGAFQFEDNCLADSSIRFSITGDTTRIETNFRFGLPYTIVSYTPSSRSEATYRDPLYSYEVGLIVLERKKAPRITKPKK